MISLRCLCSVRQNLTVQNVQQISGAISAAIGKKFYNSSIQQQKIHVKTYESNVELNTAEVRESLADVQNVQDASSSHINLNRHMHNNSIEMPPEVKKLRNPFWNIEEDQKNYDPSDVSHFIDDIGPVSPISFNLAAYANNSPTLQKLVQLGVDLSRIEEKAEPSRMLLTLDFETDVKPYIQFLHDKGVSPDDMGVLLTKNPMLLKEDLENLQIRINYLLSKKFSNEAIARIITKNAFHLMIETRKLDRRLGLLQNTFSLTGDEVRFTVTKCPRLISHEYRKFMENVFCVKEVMGFSTEERKKLVIMKPKIYTLSRKNLEERFHILHNAMGLSHNQILQFPGLFLKRGFQLKQRHEYLVHLGRAQYDPTKPGYVSIVDIATTTDNAFCRKCAKTSAEEYNNFLKTE